MRIAILPAVCVLGGFLAALLAALYSLNPAGTSAGTLGWQLCKAGASWMLDSGCVHIAQGLQGGFGTGRSQQCKLAVPNTDLLPILSVSLTGEGKRR